MKRTPMANGLAATLAVLATTSCGEAPIRPTAPPAPAATRASQPVPAEPVWRSPPPGSLLEQLMRAHFHETVTIRTAVITGHIDEAIEPARSLVNLKGVDTLPDLWEASFSELQAAADRIAQSPDLPEAAAAMSDIGRACGRCHSEVGGGPDVKLESPPPNDGSMLARMKRHLWASERLWEGLIAPSEEAWAAGVAALEMEPFSQSMIAPGGVHAKSLAERFTAAGRDAGKASEPRERGRLYATLLATCAPCHASLGVDPKPLR